MWDMLSARTADLLGLCDVKRWTVIRTSRDQNVAEHSFAVVVITMELVQRIGKIVELLGASVFDSFAIATNLWALVHDAPETLTGDIDGKFKRDFQDVRESVHKAERSAFPWYNEIARDIPYEVIKLVKVADHIEAIQFIRQWGVGARADGVLRELEEILETEDIPALLDSLNVTDSSKRLEVTTAIRLVWNRIINQSHCYQLRKYL